MKTLITYSTDTGMTRYVAELLKETLVKKNFEVDLLEVEGSKDKPIIEKYELLLFGSPTYYGGQLEAKMAELLSQYNPDLSPYKVAVFSLGDSNYRHFCASAEILEQWVNQNKGKVIVPPIKIDGYPDTEQVLQWAEQLIEVVGQ
jgi:flavodoxin I